MHPVLFKIGSFEIPSFGVAMVVAFLLSVTLAQSRGPRYGIPKSQISDMAFWAILAGILGARIFFIAQEWGYYSTHPKELFTLRFQGLTSFGGLLCGMLAAIGYAWKKGIPIRNLLDAVAPAFLVGHLIGRFGCLMNGCCFGGVCPVGTPWGIHVKDSPGLHHPAQIYDSLMNLGGLGLVLWIEARSRLKAGQVTGLVIVCHGVARFIYEFWRAGTEAQVASHEASSTYWAGLPITQAQGMAAALVLLGVAMFVFSHRRAPLPAPKEEISGAQPAA